jgi:hypothetical protein
MSRMHIAFLITDGFAARMMLRTGVPNRLIAAGARVTAISPNANEDYFRRECLQSGINLEQAPEIDSRLPELFRGYRQYFLDDVMNNLALNGGHSRRFKNQPVLRFTLEVINRTLARWRVFRKLYTAFEVRVNRSNEIKRSLARLRPDLLVLPNPFGSMATVYLLHAKELGIPVVCQMLSWDNITSKGTPLLMPDYFISWGPIMTEEMVEWYHFPREKIYECGVPHFDVYSQHGELTSRARLLEELNLPSELPYIFYGTVASIFCPNEIQILSWLANQVNNDGFVQRCSLVIRPHPQMISGSFSSKSAELERLKALAGPRVALDIPPVISERLAWDLPKSDMYHLASLLSGCAMCVNASSTLSLDACMMNRPVVNIGFDGWDSLPYHESVRRAFDFIHIAKLLRFGGIRIARSFSELETHINAYLSDAALEQEGRNMAALQECGPRDGGAAERVARSLVQLARFGNKATSNLKATTDYCLTPSERTGVSV